MSVILSKILLYAIIAVVVLCTALGIKRIFTVFFVSGSCCSSGKGLKKRGQKCACGKAER
ncbi:MAG: hypothetical protein SPL30_02815 [Succinivibrio sp.]|jgi:hypothetical protein|nr:hypothetical protein [Succinivibrio sp.]